MKHALTAIADPVYDLPTADVSAVGTRTPEPRKAYSRNNENVTFFVPIIIWHDQRPSFWGLYRTEAAQVVEGRHLFGTGRPVVGCARPVQCPPFSIRTELLGISKSNTKVLVMADKITAFMPEDCLVFDPSVDKTKLYDPVYLYIERARAILAMMQDNGQCLSEGFTIPHSVVMFNLDGIDASLTQLKKFIEIQHEAQFDALRKAEEVA